MHAVGAADLTQSEGGMIPSNEDSALSRLTHGQLDCLVLVDQHYSSKEIAQYLKISPHTVDMRIRQALQILSVERRGEAARLVALSEHGAETYQRLIHQSPELASSLSDRQQEGAVGIQIRHADRAGETSLSGSKTEQGPLHGLSPLPMPFATRSSPRNQMTTGQRLLWIVIIALGSAFAAGLYLAGLESLSRMVDGHGL